MTSRCPYAFKLSTVGWICQPCGLCLSNRQTMTKVAIFCHHARPQRGQEEMCGTNHVPTRVAYSSLATRCTTPTPAAQADNTSGERKQGAGRKSHWNPKMARDSITFAEKETLWYQAPGMFVLEWGSKIQTECCLSLRTHVKSLFVPILNPGVYLS